jgi:hypothetical protein
MDTLFPADGHASANIALSHMSLWKVNAKAL